MESHQLINTETLIIHHGLDKTFIDDLHFYGLIDFVEKDHNRFIYEDQLPVLEQLIRLYYDLEINMQGIDVIKNMIRKMDEMHHTIQLLKNKLDLYE
ncbi:chaperone modulator CbpM [Zhouia spongiae]|uniref:Chaperone modulator CbpM n=1 Tax=Zhouia spongiae TaxID=2202721 RepID=A0ABY3YJQ5_9FLAO|nr:chaperone modulator CbpM [Zhouia spongiae]UNY97928.1 chaperone modulator CbpM [Zhouia spongiae]